LTEKDWLENTQPEKMLDRLGKDYSTRKLRLFACACARQLWHLLADERSRGCILVAERHADGLADDEELATASRNADDAWDRVIQGLANDNVCGAHKAAHEVAGCEPYLTAYLAACSSAGAARETSCVPVWAAARDAARKHQASLLRDIVGNPFRPYCVRWSGGPIGSLSRVAYEERLPDGTIDPARLAVLADAVEEAGCPEPLLLDHLRSPGPHVRGCWALDLILGKE
jgi:hypothetical protein